ncbi:flavin monoamine oxidase family protein [Aquimarina sp. 2-A2]|uniref:flavin monoamine oxidase family protein n=1 Tax=Aquimarina sp. 2-A2 TaxID=3382644 RepID=UPI00387F1CD2
MIIIIGAGLSGLLIGYRLKKEGVPFKILEARARIGGRIHTVCGSNSTPVEMGATWFTDQHTNLLALIDELAIEKFEQYMGRTAYFQPSATTQVQSIQIPTQPPSYRIAGGTSHLINTLYQQLDSNDVLLNQTVSEIKFHEKSVEIIANQTFIGDRVILAMPPKLWANNISFEPPLPTNLVQIGAETHTWMEDSIKVALIYKQPFWEQQHTSATLFSNMGPVTELYDHCDFQRSHYALCGFIHPSFKNLTDEDRRIRVIEQMQKIHGAKAGEYIEYKECIWKNEKYTYEVSAIELFPHQNNGNAIFNASLFEGKLLLAGSEVAPEFPGYMEGAVYSANTIAQKIVKAQSL